jgi:hypothetical protein
MKKGIKYRKIKWLESLLDQGFVRILYSITTDLKSWFNGFNQLFYCNTYIRAAGGLFHWNRGLSLFHALRFFYAPTSTRPFYFLTSNNDTK